MVPSLRSVLAALVITSVATACSETAVSPAEPLALKGGISGGGGGTPKAPKNGRINAVGAAASCTAGSTMSVSLRRGFDDRIEAVIVARAAAEPTGPAIPPSTFPQTSLGGYQTFRIADEAQNLAVMSFGGTQGLSTSSYTITNLGRGLPPGNYTFTFTSVNYQENGVTDYLYLRSLPPHEVCTATLTATLS